MKTHDPLVLKKPGIWVRKSTLDHPHTFAKIGPHVQCKYCGTKKAEQR